MRLRHSKDYVMREFISILVFLSVLNTTFAYSEENVEVVPEAEPINQPMNNERLHELLQRIDPELKGHLGLWTMEYKNFVAQKITDVKADRMRVIVPIVNVKDVDEAEFLRLMQANFDSVLDARYCIANGVIWSAFIHQLSILSDEELLSGLAQALTAAASFGTTYSSGALIFRGGDSGDQQRKFYESIIEKGLAI